MSVTKVGAAMQDLTDDYAFTGTVSGAGAPSHRNDIINGGYLINQENDTAAADDDYSIGDLFLHVGEAAVTTSLQTSGGPQGDRNFARINIDTANKQSGWVYFLSNADCQDYIANGKMSFGIKVKTVADKVIGTVRIGLLKWTGTADAVTSDVVGTWAQDGTSPTLSTNWSYENTPADIDITTSWARYTVEDVTVDSDTNNLACFVWIDDGTIAEDDQLDVTEWQLNPGATVHAFSQPHFTTVQEQIWYTLERQTYDGDNNEMIHQGRLHSTTQALIDMTWKARKRIAAQTITTSAAAGFSCSDHAGLHAVSNMGGQNNGGRFSDRFTLTIATSGAAAGDSTTLLSESSGNFIQIDCRL
jgi:hypothetical protein